MKSYLFLVIERITILRNISISNAYLNLMTAIDYNHEHFLHWSTFKNLLLIESHISHHQTPIFFSQSKAIDIMHVNIFLDRLMTASEPALALCPREQSLGYWQKSQANRWMLNINVLQWGHSLNLNHPQGYHSRVLYVIPPGLVPTVWKWLRREFGTNLTK